MRPIIRAVLVTLVVSLGVIAAAEEGWAAFAGGSRLIFYYTQRSIVNPAAAPGSAATLVSVTNHRTDSPVTIRVNIFNGVTCAGFGPLTFTLGPRNTLRFNVADQVLASSFLEGWVDVRAVDAAGVPIRYDQMSGKGTILDFGFPTTAAATYEAAALFSDANRSMPLLQGTVIADNFDPNTRGADMGTADFWAAGGSFGVGHRLAVIPVSIVPGEAPVASSYSLSWKKTDGTGVGSFSAASSCMIAGSLASLHPDFATTYPFTGLSTNGGNLTINVTSFLANKGFVGALFETATTPPVLAVHSIQQGAAPSPESHE